MANMNKNNPTAANILSSLEVKGATSVGGAEQEWKLPVLNGEGVLDTSLLPIERISESIDVPTLGDTAYVDPSAGADVEGYQGTGSIVKPFRTLDEAASYNAGGKTFANFLLVSGSPADYSSAHPNFATRETIIRIFSTGTVQFGSLSFDWLVPETRFILNNISVSSVFHLRTELACLVQITGASSIGTLRGSVDNSGGLPQMLTDVEIDPSVKILSFTNIKSLGYLASGIRIANGSSRVRGETVAEATDTLGNRRIRIPKFTADVYGVHIGSVEDVQADSDSSDDYELHDITDIGYTLTEALNSTFYKKGDSPEFNSVTASKVRTDMLTASTSVRTEKTILGHTPIYVDTDNFLMIGSPEYESSDSSSF